MSKVLLSIFLFVYIASFSQNYPAKSVDLLLNKIVKPKVVDEINRKYSYKNFYSKFDIKTKELKTFDKSHRAFPINAYTSDYTKLVGQELVVFAIYDKKVSNSSKEGRYYVLELFNEALGTVYYHYDSEFEYGFELEIVGGLELPEGFYCKDIEISEDKFTGEITKKSNYSDGISFIKVSKENASKIFLAINEVGSTPNVGKKGLILLLENNKRINRPEAKIDVKVGGKKYVYSAFIELSTKEIDLIINNSITDDRLYIYDGKVSNGKKLSEYLKCLKNN